MLDIFYAGIIIVITGIIGLAIGLFDIFTKSEKPYGYGKHYATIEVTDVHQYNKAVGKLWLMTGILICIVGASLMLPNAESYAAIAAFIAIGIYVLGSVYYVVSIEKRFNKNPTQTEGKKK